MLDTNLIGPFLLIKNTLPAMIERGGSIINVTSDAGQVGYPGWGATAFPNLASKACRKPGRRSARERRASQLGRSREHEHGDASRRRTGGRTFEWADPADVTDVFVFLASDESKGVTGKRFQAQEDWKAVLLEDAASPTLEGGSERVSVILVCSAAGAERKRAAGTSRYSARPSAPAGNRSPNGPNRTHAL